MELNVGDELVLVYELGFEGNIFIDKKEEVIIVLILVFKEKIREI